MKLLILTYPRSGGRYIFTVLRDYGVQIGHEDVASDGVVSWKHLLEPADLVLHQVRYPLDAIYSVQGMRGDSRRYIRTFTGLNEQPGLLFAAKAYLAWHDLIEQRNPVARYRVEDLPWPRTAHTDHDSHVSMYGPPSTFEDIRSLDEDTAYALEALTLMYGYDIK